MTLLFKGLSWGLLFGFLMAVISINHDDFLYWTDDLPIDVVLEKY